jgi:pyrroloquinoline-quinone synthase
VSGNGVPALGRDAFAARLRHEGERRYHDRHPYHVAMHEGRLTAEQLRQWVLNRYYYQTRIPVKDALILAKSDDARFRRVWIERIRDHDGDEGDEGGLERWLRLAGGVGLAPEVVASCRDVLPDVRAACDAYVELVRGASLVEAVAASLTECFAPDLMQTRIRAWERHYPWVRPEALAYFRSRVPRARRDGAWALAFVLDNAVTRTMQERCVAALVFKTSVLTALLDALTAAYAPELRAAGDARHEAAP